MSGRKRKTPSFLLAPLQQSDPRSTPTRTVAIRYTGSHPRNTPKTPSTGRLRSLPPSPRLPRVMFHFYAWKRQDFRLQPGFRERVWPVLVCDLLVAVLSLEKQRYYINRAEPFCFPVRFIYSSERHRRQMINMAVARMKPLPG